MAVGMPVVNGIDAAKIIKARQPEVKIMMLTTRDDLVAARQAIQCGAAGYVLKNIGANELIHALRTIQDGLVLISPGIARQFAGPASAESEEILRRRSDLRDRLMKLSKREKQAFALLLKGYDNQRIADTLFISRQTVKNHVSAIYNKLGVRDRTHALMLAYQAGTELSRVEESESI
jgi:DNA-binding NarL/FixJ family response regulator